jgi:chromosome partitioning protein
MARSAGARARIILIASPKGGVGKSAVCSHILVSAATAGHQVLGIDLDQQGTLTKWHARREWVRKSHPACVDVPVIASKLDDWRDVMAQAASYELVVIDTPPGIEYHIDEMLRLSGAADLVLVPTGATQTDLDSVAPWMASLEKGNARAAFVLNKANRRVKSYEVIRAKLLQAGPLCPVEIPTLEDIHTATGNGLAVPDIAKAKAADIFGALWAYVRREVGLRQRVAA